MSGRRYTSQSFDSSQVSNVKLVVMINEQIGWFQIRNHEGIRIIMVKSVHDAGQIPDELSYCNQWNRIAIHNVVEQVIGIIRHKNNQVRPDGLIRDLFADQMKIKNLYDTFTLYRFVVFSYGLKVVGDFRIQIMSG